MGALLSPAFAPRQRRLDRSEPAKYRKLAVVLSVPVGYCGGQRLIPFVTKGVLPPHTGAGQPESSRPFYPLPHPGRSVHAIDGVRPMGVISISTFALVGVGRWACVIELRTVPVCRVRLIGTPRSDEGK